MFLCQRVHERFSPHSLRCRIVPVGEHTARAQHVHSMNTRAASSALHPDWLAQDWVEIAAAVLVTQTRYFYQCVYYMYLLVYGA